MCGSSRDRDLVFAFASNHAVRSGQREHFIRRSLGHLLDEYFTVSQKVDTVPKHVRRSIGSNRTRTCEELLAHDLSAIGFTAGLKPAS